MDLDSLAARLGKQNQLGVIGCSSMVNTHTELRAETPDRTGTRKLKILKEKKKKNPSPSKPQTRSDSKRQRLKRRDEGQKDPIQVPLPELEVLTVH